jgi:hypothetical protein
LLKTKSRHFADQPALPVPHFRYLRKQFCFIITKARPLGAFMDIFSHSTQICGEYAFDAPQGQVRATGNQGLAQRDFSSMDFLKRRLHEPISLAKISLLEIK